MCYELALTHLVIGALSVKSQVMLLTGTQPTERRFPMRLLLR